MSEFKELVKSFPKTREYVRDFFVYGFKTRAEFKGKSPRTYDNERRRIESWLSSFVKGDYTAKGKNISLAIDSNLLDTNPLYRVWKTRSFTDNDIMLHFFLLDFLSDGKSCTAEHITDGILNSYTVFFDVQTVRRKCNDYIKEGLLLKEKNRKELLYRIASDCRPVFNQVPMLYTALLYYSLAAPLGIIGDTILDVYSLKNDIFRVKHSFFVHTLEDEILLGLLDAMQKQLTVRLHMQSSKGERTGTQSGVPLQIFTSTRTGRRFLCIYSEKNRRFTCIRMDAIKKLTPLEPSMHYEKLKAALQRNHPYIWGVSFQSTEKKRLQYIKLTLHINERSEAFILNRLEREGKGGTIARIAPDTFIYEKEVFDANEMLPWIRTFAGRIIDLKSSSLQLKVRFYEDMKKMYRMYSLKKDSKEDSV